MKFSELKTLTEESYDSHIKYGFNSKDFTQIHTINTIKKFEKFFTIKGVDLIEKVNLYFNEHKIRLNLQDQIEYGHNHLFDYVPERYIIYLSDRNGKNMRVYDSYSNTDYNDYSKSINVFKCGFVKSYRSAMDDRKIYPQEFYDAVWYALGENYKQNQTNKIISNQTKIKELEAEIEKLASENFKTESGLKNSNSDLELN